MDFLNLFPWTNKKDIEKEQRDRDRRDRHEECNKKLEKIIKSTKREIEEREKEKEKEKVRVKIIQPLDIEKMEEFKNRTIQFIFQCKKKEYIYDSFQRMSSIIFFSQNNFRPRLNELCLINIKSIPEDEEQELRLLMNNLEYDDPRNREILARTYSIVVIDILYDNCKSIDTGIAEINKNSNL